MIFILIITKFYYSRIFKVRASTNRSADIRQGRDLERTADFSFTRFKRHAGRGKKEGDPLSPD
jgi:hypothetical protein